MDRFEQICMAVVLVVVAALVTPFAIAMWKIAIAM